MPNTKTDWQLGIDRAREEIRWMARGYVAYLSHYVLVVTENVRQTVPYDLTGTYADALKAVSTRVEEIRDTGELEIYRITCDQIIERLSQIPHDPADEHFLTRRDGLLPTSSRNYKVAA